MNTSLIAARRDSESFTIDKDDFDVVEEGRSFEEDDQEGREDVLYEKIFSACKKGEEQKLLGLLETNKKTPVKIFVDEKRNNLLHYACFKNMPQAIQALMLREVPLNAVNIGGLTPLHLLCFHELPALAKQMIELGAKKGIQDNDGDTPLHIACRESKLGMINILAKAVSKKTLNKRNHDHDTPLFISIREKHIPAIRILLKQGADTSLEDVNRRKPHEQAAAFFENFPKDLIEEMRKKSVPLKERFISNAKKLIHKEEE